MLFQAFTAASFSFGGLLPSVSSSAGKRYTLQGLSVEIDLASLKPSTSCPDELCCFGTMFWVIILLHDEGSPNQFGCIFLQIVRQNISVDFWVNFAAAVMCYIINED